MYRKRSTAPEDRRQQGEVVSPFSVIRELDFRSRSYTNVQTWIIDESRLTRRDTSVSNNGDFRPLFRTWLRSKRSDRSPNAVSRTTEGNEAPLAHPRPLPRPRQGKTLMKTANTQWYKTHRLTWSGTSSRSIRRLYICCLSSLRLSFSSSPSLVRSWPARSPVALCSFAFNGLSRTKTPVHTRKPRNRETGVKSKTRTRDSRARRRLVHKTEDTTAIQHNTHTLVLPGRVTAGAVASYILRYRGWHSVRTRDRERKRESKREREKEGTAGRFPPRLAKVVKTMRRRDREWRIGTRATDGARLCLSASNFSHSNGRG